MILHEHDTPLLRKEEGRKMINIENRVGLTVKRQTEYTEGNREK